MMTKRSFGWMLTLLVMMVAIGSAPIALSQMEQGPTVYTMVSQFQVPRASWAQYSEDTDKSFVPIAEKLVADGTLVGYSTFEHVVHTPEGFTHGAAWSSTSLAGLMKMLDEIRKAGPRQGQIAATKHEDYLMVTRTQHASSVSGGTGFLRVVCSMAKADDPDAYGASLKKFLGATFDEQFKKGVATSYGLDAQYVNNGAPSLRCLVITYPSAENMDKWAAAVNGTLGKMSAADRAEFAATTVADSRRDILARITHYAHK
jgi:hypothetical protein